MLLIIKLCCSRHQRSKILKANHNGQSLATSAKIVVTAHLKKRYFVDNIIVVNNWERLRF